MNEVRSLVLNLCLENDLISTCRLRLPNEACGIIYGSIVNEAVVAEGFAVVRNVSANPSRSFLFEPQQWIALYYEAQKNQRHIVGFFHSHPNGSGQPSAEDERSWTPWGTYCIVSLADGRAGITAYRKDLRQEWVSLPVQRELLNA